MSMSPWAHLLMVGGDNWGGSISPRLPSPGSRRSGLPAARRWGQRRQEPSPPPFWALESAFCRRLSPQQATTAPCKPRIIWDWRVVNGCRGWCHNFMVYAESRLHIQSVYKRSFRAVRTVHVRAVTTSSFHVKMSIFSGFWPQKASTIYHFASVCL